MPVSLMSIFAASLLLNHVGLLRLAAADELGQRTLSHVPLCSGLLTGITLIISITCLTLIHPYLNNIATFRVLSHFVFLLLIGLIAHIVCAIVYKLKPMPAIGALFPLILINSIALSIITQKVNLPVNVTVSSIIVATVFTLMSMLLYYSHLWFNQSETLINSKRLSILLLITSVLILILFVFITFY